MNMQIYIYDLPSRIFERTNFYDKDTIRCELLFKYIRYI